MSAHKRAWLVLLSVLAMVAVVVLGSGLSTLDLEKGEPLPRMPREEKEPDVSSPMPPVLALAIRVSLLVVAALLPFSIIYYLISPQARKRLLRDLLFMLSLLLLIYVHSLLRAESDVIETIEEFQSGQGAARELPPAPDVTFAPDPSQWLTLAVTIGLALLLAVLLVGLAWAFWRRRQRPATSLDRLAQEAQYAVEAIEAGADIRDTVTRCYFEMMQVLKEERDIQRQRAMTPREFEARLERLGVPTAQVRRLTRLFEDVRYGDKQLDQQEERQAVISLTAIVRFCRSVS